MKRVVLSLLLAALAVPVPAAAPAGAGEPPGSPEGRWRLVEQRYERGEANLADGEAPVRLELKRTGGAIGGSVWTGEDRSRAVVWPAFVTDEGALPVEVLSRDENVASGTLSVRYRVRPSAEDDLFLEIVEEYAVAPGGGEMAGRLSVRFTGGETHRGGFVLHRRFVRER